MSIRLKEYFTIGALALSSPAIADVGAMYQDLEAQAHECITSKTDCSRVKTSAELLQIMLDLNAKLTPAPEVKYLENPYNSETKTLTINSERHIVFFGQVNIESAIKLVASIRDFNIKSNDPIFLEITESTGGDAHAAYAVIQAMKSSKAPVYVFVTGYAYSAAANILSHASHSYAYPGAVIMFHQVMHTITGMNEQALFRAQSSMKPHMSELFATLVKKTGKTEDELIASFKQKDNNWFAHGEEAYQMKWIDGIIHRVEFQK